MVCLVNTTVFCYATKGNLYIELVNVVPVPFGSFVVEPPSKVDVKLLGEGSGISLNLPHLKRMRGNLDVYAASMPVDWTNVNVAAIVVFFNDEPVAKTHVNGLSFNDRGDVIIHLTRKGPSLEISR